MVPWQVLKTEEADSSCELSYHVYHVLPQKMGKEREKGLIFRFVGFSQASYPTGANAFPGTEVNLELDLTVLKLVSSCKVQRFNPLDDWPVSGPSRPRVLGISADRSTMIC